MPRSRFSIYAAGWATALAALTGATAVTAPSASAQPADDTCPWVASSAPIAQRVDQLMSRMTVDEKLHELHGDNSSAYAGTVPAIPRLCIPALTLDDSPAGVGHGMTGVTQLPSPVSLAATWDPQLGKMYGQVVGSEQRGKGDDVDLGPTVNIVRDPRWGRAFETYGEDPYLSGQIGAADVEGIQNTGEMAQLKHFAVYNQETNRNNSTDDAIIDPRVEQELYLSQFKTVIDDAKPASVMCSYSFINGQAACQDPYIMTSVLRDQWKYPGFVTSDWGGTHSTVASVQAQMNMEMPDGNYYGEPLADAVQSGAVSADAIDSLVRPILTQMFRFHLFTDPPTGTPSSVVTTPQHQAIGERIAQDGTVLLKNAGNVLPLSPSKKSSIAVIGDDAGADALTTGGGSAEVQADSVVTPYQGIAKAAGRNADVTYALGNSPFGGLPPVSGSALAPTEGSGSGLTGTYYAGTDLSGTPLATRNTDQLAFNWNGRAPMPGVPSSNWSAKYTATLTAPSTGTYKFAVTSDDGSRLFVDGKQIIDNWRDQGATTETADVTLTAGQSVPVEIDYFQDGGGSALQFGWIPPGGPTTPEQQAVDTARSSDVAVVFASNDEAEGSDLANIDLPDAENSLIEKVAAVNPNTIVVLNTGSAVTMPWLADVKGVFEAWYPGQNFGDAIAALLFGKANPSGKLPVSFPQSLADVPAATPQQWPGVDGKVQYSEGLQVGYRWYDAQHIDPMFAFGSGLSYTTFAYSHLKVSRKRTTSLDDVTVTADVTNTGQRAGADVAQLYVGQPQGNGEPPRQLKGFKRVSLEPGQTKTVTFTVTPQDLGTYDTTTQSWQVTDGTYQLMVGDSSAQLPLHGSVDVTRSYGPQGVTLHLPDVVAAGDQAQATATFVNGADVPVSSVDLVPSVPAGWTVTPRSAHATKVAAHSRTTFTFTVSVPGNVAPGPASVAVTAKYTAPRVGRAAVTPVRQDVSVPYPDWAAAYNNTGISDNADPTAADFDGSGYSFSAQELAAKGITPGGTVSADGASFTWPDVAAGQPDNVSTQGQLVTMGGSGTSLHLLGAGAPGDQTGTVTAMYTDGTSSSASVTFADWWSNNPAGSDTLVATTDNWNQPPNGSGPHAVSLYATSVPLTAGKTLAYLVLPDTPGLHLFGVDVE